MKKKIIYGVAYNALLNNNPDSDNKNEKLNFKLSKEEIYNHPKIRLNRSKDDLKLDNKPIYLEHKTDTQIGSILCSWLDNEKIKILAEVYGSEDLINDIESGSIGSLSMGYVYDVKSNKKTINEVSLCREPFFDGCNFSVAASKKNDSSIYKKKSLFNYCSKDVDELKFVVIMASGNQPNTNADPLDNLSKEDIKQLLTEFQKTKNELEKVKKLEIELSEKNKSLEKTQTLFQEKFKKDQAKMQDDFLKNLKSNTTADISEEEMQLISGVFGNLESRPIADILTKVVSSVKMGAPPQQKTGGLQQGGVGDVYSAPKRSFSEMSNQSEPSMVPITAHKEPSAKRFRADDDQARSKETSSKFDRLLQDVLKAPSIVPGATSFGYIPTLSQDYS
jgi:hypothetical protein